MRPPVFIPRPETEQLIDIVLANTPEEVTNGMEIGCGSGAISIALLQERKNVKVHWSKKGASKVVAYSLTPDSTLFSSE